MVDNPLVEKIAAMCPFEADYQRYTEHECFTRLPRRADHRGCALTHMARKNQVFYFQGWNAFTILFGDCGAAPFDVVHLDQRTEGAAAKAKAGHFAGTHRFYKMPRSLLT